MPKISVIIPTYNRAHFIAEALQSVLCQTFADFEVIIVDDGSIDNTKEVVDSFKDPRIKYIYEENSRMSIARNTGINASSSEYIAFLDSDDVLVGNALEKGVKVLDRYPEVAFSYGWKYIIDEKGSVLKLFKKMQKKSCVREGSDQIRDFLIYGHKIGVCGTMVRRRCLCEVGLFDPTFHYGSEDFDFLVRLARKYAVAFIGEPVGKIRVHPNKITNTRDLGEIEKSNARILEGVFNDVRLGLLLSSQRPKAYFHLYLRLASYAYERKEMKTARRYLFKALKMRPKGFLKGLCLPWILLFTKTWLPLQILGSACKVKSYLGRVIRRISTSSESLKGEIGHA